MPEIIIRASARHEIKAHGIYLDENAGPEVTERFLLALEESFALLASAPRAGVRCGFRKTALRRVRRWPVQDFEKWLIFYLPKRDGVDIIHIIHGARDIESLLDT